MLPAIKHTCNKVFDVSVVADPAVGRRDEFLSVSSLISSNTGGQSTITWLVFVVLLSLCGMIGVDAVPFTVTSGADACEIVDNNNCFQSVNYPGNYGDGKTCTITVNDVGILNVSGFAVEPHDTCGYDYMTVKGTKYCGTTSPNLEAINSGAQITWYSDSETNKKGFKICYAPPLDDCVEATGGTVNNNACLCGTTNCLAPTRRVCFVWPLITNVPKLLPVPTRMEVKIQTPVLVGRKIVQHLLVCFVWPITTRQFRLGIVWRLCQDQIRCQTAIHRIILVTQMLVAQHGLTVIPVTEVVQRRAVV